MVDVVRLDSACCNLKERRTLLHLYPSATTADRHSFHVRLTTLVPKRMVGFLKWIFIRNFSVNKLVVAWTKELESLFIVASAQYNFLFPQVKEIFTFDGHANGHEYKWALLFSWFPNIETVRGRCLTDYVATEIQTILVRNSKIQSIYVTVQNMYCQRYLSEIIMSCKCKLKGINCSDGCSADTLMNVSRYCPHLEDVSFHPLVSHNILFTVLPSLRHLKSLVIALDGVNITVEVLSQLFDNLNLQGISLESVSVTSVNNSNLLLDSLLLKIITTCPRLSILQMSAIKYERCAAKVTLQINPHTYSAGSLIEFCECLKVIYYLNVPVVLKTSCFHGYDNELFNALLSAKDFARRVIDLQIKLDEGLYLGVFEIIHNCPNLKQLTLEHDKAEMNAIPHLFRLLLNVRPQLYSLFLLPKYSYTNKNISDQITYNDYVSELIRGLPTLQVLDMPMLPITCEVIKCIAEDNRVWDKVSLCDIAMSLDELKTAYHTYKPKIRQLVFKFTSRHEEVSVGHGKVCIKSEHVERLVMPAPKAWGVLG